MTMTTSVRINAPINPIELLDWLTVECGGDPATIQRRDDIDKAGVKHVWNRRGQGLLALCDVEFCPDGVLPTRSEWHEDDEPDWPAAVVECSFDTPYGFEVNGAHCGDWHRFLLDRVHQWCRSMGVDDDRIHWFAGEFLMEWAPITDMSEHTGDLYRGASVLGPPL